MSVRRFAFAIVAIAPLALPARAQTIDPGMTREQVVEQFGPPVSERHFGAHDYLLFDSGCGRRCGTDDLVILDHGGVVDAIVRSPGRKYSAADVAPDTLASIESKRPQPAAIAASTSADSAHRGGMVFEGPRVPGQPARYQVIVPRRDTAGGSAPHN